MNCRSTAARSKGSVRKSAADLFTADIGIKGGRIAALGHDLAKGDDEIDARGRLVLPGGIDAHCHLDQLSSFGVPSADDYFTGTRSAACGGTTTVLSFSMIRPGAVPFGTASWASMVVLPPALRADVLTLPRRTSARSRRVA